MDHSAAISYHEDELGLRKNLVEIHSRAQREGILIAEPLRWAAMFDDDFQYKGSHRVVQDVGSDSGLLQTLRLDGGLHPLLAEAQNAGNDSRLLTAADVGVGVQEDAEQSGPRAGHPADEDERHRPRVGHPAALSALQFAVHKFLLDLEE